MYDRSFQKCILKFYNKKIQWNNAKSWHKTPHILCHYDNERFGLSYANLFMPNKLEFWKKKIRIETAKRMPFLIFYFSTYLRAS